MVRAFNAGDAGAVRALFPRAGEGSPAASLWGHHPSEAAIYLTPYMEREPESLLLGFVEGEMVGYLTGCVESSRFPSEDDRFEHAVKAHRVYLRPKAIPFFVRALLDTAVDKARHEPGAGDFVDARWPSHFHINVVPSARGSGIAQALMNSWFERLTFVDSPGCYLQTLVENTRAVRFFARMGFVEHGSARLVPGVRYDGRRVHQQTMVKPAR